MPSKTAWRFCRWRGARIRRLRWAWISALRGSRRLKILRSSLSSKRKEAKAGCWSLLGPGIRALLKSWGLRIWGRNERKLKGSKQKGMNPKILEVWWRRKWLKLLQWILDTRNSRTTMKGRSSSSTKKRKSLRLSWKLRGKDTNYHKEERRKCKQAQKTWRTLPRKEG